MTRASILVLAAALAACTPQAAHYREAESPKTIDVRWVQWSQPVPAGAAGALPADARQAIDSFLAGLRLDDYADHVYVAAPPQAPRAKAVSDYLAAHGIRAERVGPTAANPEGTTLVVGRYIAIPPACPNWQQPTGGDAVSLPGSNFGCATATNLANMVADPGDLVRGRELGPIDPTIAAAAVERYRTDKLKKLPKNFEPGAFSGRAPE